MTTFYLPILKARLAFTLSKFPPDFRNYTKNWRRSWVKSMKRLLMQKWMMFTSWWWWPDLITNCGSLDWTLLTKLSLPTSLHPTWRQFCYQYCELISVISSELCSGSVWYLCSYLTVVIEPMNNEAFYNPFCYLQLFLSLTNFTNQQTTQKTFCLKNIVFKVIKLNRHVYYTVWCKPDE